MTRLLRKLMLILVAFIIIVFVLFDVIKIQDIILKKIYPKKYSEYVEMYSKEYGVEDKLIYAIIKAESNFDEQAQSHKNARGLMQLMNSTAKDVADSMKLEYNEEDFSKPDINIQLGVKYISNLIDKYNNIELALAAYNAGSGNVDNWIKDNILKKDGSDIENIPYKETNNYVRKILRDYKIYKELYSPSLASDVNGDGDF